MHNKRKKILVAGGRGQLGQCLEKLSAQYELEYKFKFCSSSDLDITNSSSIEEVFEDFKPHYCINAAAYTAVDLAESEEERAFLINAQGVENLALACKEYGVKLIHISTDYVFDGDTNLSYEEDNFTSPLGVYGASKREGEILALEANPRTVILRTSWLYSEFSKNFVTTMLNLFEQKKELGIVHDQFGQPTNANDLAQAIMDIISHREKVYGIFHFSNYPETTWFEFASKIAQLSKSEIQLNRIDTSNYPTPAPRPKRSTMALDKIEKVYGIEAKYWDVSLEETVELLTTKE
ncbi:dTDP-4-dehydrorhamnose reductase [Chryseobacterium sp. A321]